MPTHTILRSAAPQLLTQGSAGSVQPNMCWLWTGSSTNEKKIIFVPRIFLCSFGAKYFLKIYFFVYLILLLDWLLLFFVCCAFSFTFFVIFVQLSCWRVHFVQSQIAWLRPVVRGKDLADTCGGHRWHDLHPTEGDQTDEDPWILPYAVWFYPQIHH